VLTGGVVLHAILSVCATSCGSSSLLVPCCTQSWLSRQPLQVEAVLLAAGCALPMIWGVLQQGLNREGVVCPRPTMHMSAWLAGAPSAVTAGVTRGGIVISFFLAVYL
jgi:hypothetical protein